MDVAKQYAARNRQGNAWFSHDENKNAASIESAVQHLNIVEESPQQSIGAEAAAPATPARETLKAEQMASPVSEPIKSEPAAALPSHQSTPVEPTPSFTPSKSESVASPPGSTGRAHMIKPTCNSNQWYKQSDNNGNGSGSRMRQTTTGKKTRPVSQPVDWFSHEKHGDVKPESKLRVTDEEGASYCRRDKMGTSGAWFGHSASGGGDASIVTPRVTTQEGASNANRMRGESENWYNYSGSPGGVREPVHVSKGRAANRPQSNEMHGIFHHGI